MIKLIQLFSLLFLLRTASFGENYEAITYVSKELTLSFPSSGKIAKVFVKEGQSVSKGSPLLLLDDSELQMRLELLDVQLEDLTSLQAAEIDLKKRVMIVNKLKEVGDAASKTEIERADFEKRSAEIHWKLQKTKKRKLQIERKILVQKIEKMKLLSPESATVEILHQSVGENVERLQKVIYLVNTEVLYIDIAVGLDLAKSLIKGARAEVHFPDRSQQTVHFVYKTSFAEAASETRIVRFKFNNNNKRPAGEKVTVKFNL